MWVLAEVEKVNGVSEEGKYGQCTLYTCMKIVQLSLLKLF
jgi:hypothetical protein